MFKFALKGSVCSNRIHTQKYIFSLRSCSQFPIDGPSGGNSNATSSQQLHDDMQKRLQAIIKDIPTQKPSLNNSESLPLNDEANLKADSNSSFSSGANEVYGKDDSSSTNNQDSATQRQSQSQSQSPPHSSNSKSNSSGSNSSFYMDIFSIKQILDTVKEGENFKQLQFELSKFYAAKKKASEDIQQSFSKKLDNNVQELKKSIKIASSVVNDITGYSKVMDLRDLIMRNESRIKELRTLVHNAKKDYEDAVNLRSSSQKEINILLEGKNNWTPVELERFTKLYMNNHDLESAVLQSKSNLKKLEVEEEDTHDELIKAIMDRYHEEQVWSDKIRQFSTWATVLILCANVTLVVLVQLVFEPYKRYRLVNSFEEKVKDLFKNNQKLDGDINDLKHGLVSLEKSLKAEDNGATTFTPVDISFSNSSIASNESDGVISSLVSTMGTLFNPEEQSSEKVNKYQKPERLEFTKDSILQYSRYFLNISQNVAHRQWELSLQLLRQFREWFISLCHVMDPVFVTKTPITALEAKQYTWSTLFGGILMGILMSKSIIV